MQQLQPLRTEQAAAEERHPRKVSAGPVETGNETHLHWIVADHKHDRDGRVGNPHRLQRRSIEDDHRRLAAEQVGGEARQPIRLIVRPALLDSDVASVDEPFLAQAVAKLCHDRRERRSGRAAQQPDYRQPRLLRARRERPCRSCAAEKDDELSPFHSITSSARASSVGGTSKPKVLAVFRLTTNSNLVPCCTGRSAGFAPLRILSTKLAERYHMSLMLAK